MAAVVAAQGWRGIRTGQPKAAKPYFYTELIQRALERSWTESLYVRIGGSLGMRLLSESVSGWAKLKKGHWTETGIRMEAPCPSDPQLQVL